MGDNNNVNNGHDQTVSSVPDKMLDALRESQAQTAAALDRLSESQGHVSRLLDIIEKMSGR